MNEWVNKWINICSWWQNKGWLKCGNAAVHSQNSVGFWQTQCSNFNWLAEQEQRREMRHVFCHFPTVFLFWACQGSPLEIIYGKSSVFSRRQGPRSLWILKYLTLPIKSCSLQRVLLIGLKMLKKESQRVCWIPVHLFRFLQLCYPFEPHGPHQGPFKPLSRSTGSSCEPRLHGCVPPSSQGFALLPVLLWGKHALQGVGSGNAKGLQ